MFYIYIFPHGMNFSLHFQVKTPPNRLLLKIHWTIPYVLKSSLSSNQYRIVLQTSKG